MKKFLIIAVILIAGFPLLGFSLDYGAIINNNGTVTEYVSIYCDDTTLESLNISQADLNEVFSSACSDVVENLRINIINKINSDTELNSEIKQHYLKNIALSSNILENKFFVSIKYGSVEIWKYFCSEENVVTQEYHYLFLTYDVISTIKPRISIITTENNVYAIPQFVYNLLSDKITQEWGQEALTALENPKYSYSYVTVKRRVHSNADEMFYNGGFWYHTWSIESIDDSLIEIYTTYANTVIWYLIAVGLTALFLLLIFLKSKFDSKHKKQIKKNIKS